MKFAGKHRDDMFELLFKERPKDYGAYDLKRRIDGNTSLGFVISILLICSFFIVPYTVYTIKQKRVAKMPVRQVRVVTYAELSAPPPIEALTQPPPKAKPAPVKAQVKYLPPVVKPDEEVPDEELIPTQEELADVNPGLANVAGSDSVVWQEPEVVEVPKPEVIPPPPKKVEPFKVVEQMPEYPGGYDAMYAYLSAQIRYPQIAMESGIQGKVWVQFIIEPDGRVSNVKTVRGIGGGCDEEAERVIAGMPPWKPGKQRGIPVPVQFTLPVNFVIAK